MKVIPERIVVRREPTSRKGGWNYLLQCKLCSKQFWYPGYEFNFGRGQYCSLKCANESPERAKNAKEKLPSQVGSNNNNWRGGVAIYQKYRKDSCQKCGKKKYELTGYKREPLIVHHIDHNRRNGSPDNLITLCEKCHKAEHKKPITRPEQDRFM